MFDFSISRDIHATNMSLNLPDNDPFFKKQPIRIRKKRLQESSRLRQKNLHQELEALPLLKGT